jgi:hypothetical protein
MHTHRLMDFVFRGCQLVYVGVLCICWGVITIKWCRYQTLSFWKVYL